jgi:hypothetical protein
LKRNTAATAQRARTVERGETVSDRTDMMVMSLRRR